MQPLPPEPATSDLAFDSANLEALLSERITNVNKAINRRFLKETKAAVDAFLASREAWEVLENIQVWEMIRCDCGHCGTIVLARNMQRRRKSGLKIINLCTVDELPPDTPVTLALSTRHVRKCEYCSPPDITEFRDFKEVVG